MIGIWSTYTNIFLYIVGIAMLLAYGLPLTFAPLALGKGIRLGDATCRTSDDHVRA